jgi:hypothetical protein
MVHSPTRADITISTAPMAAGRIDGRSTADRTRQAPEGISSHADWYDYVRPGSEKPS